MLDEGNSVPSVSAQNQDGETVAPDFSTPTVVYFYPKDDSPGCSVETEQFNAELDTYHDAGIDVYGVSTDDVQSHKDFHSKYDLEFDLLADPDAELADAFGVTTSGGTADRVTFVIDKQTVEHVYTDVDPDGHAKAVLESLLGESTVGVE